MDSRQSFDLTKDIKDKVSPVLFLRDVFAARASGIARFQNEKVIRQIHFSNGDLTSVLSNAKSELPGSILLDAGKMGEAEFHKYLELSSIKGARPWKVAAEITGLDNEALSPFRTLHSLRILSSILKLKESLISFSPGESSSSTPVTRSLDAVLRVSKNLSYEELRQIQPFLQRESAILCLWGKNFAPEKLGVSPSEKGLLTLLSTSKTIAEVFEGSFLEENEIWSLCFAFWLLGLTNYESTEEKSSREHVSTLNEDEFKVRKEVLILYEGLTNTNYFKILRLDSSCSSEQVEKHFRALTQRYNPEVIDKLFLENEKSMLKSVNTFIQDAYMVLSHPEKRKEYEIFLAENREGSFLDASITIQEEKVLNALAKMDHSHEIEKTLGALETHIASLPQSKRLRVAFAEKILNHAKLSMDNTWISKAFEKTKGLIEDSPEAKTWGIIGTLLAKLGQTDKSFVAARRGLEIDPFERYSTALLLSKDPLEANTFVLRVLEKRLGDMNHYSLLGLSAFASRGEIQGAYRECTKRFHPDRFFHSADMEQQRLAKDIYKRMVEAYMTLKNPDRKAKYDRLLIASQKIGVSISSISEKVQEADQQEPRTAQGRKYYQLVIEALKKGDRQAAKLNLQLGLQAEPKCIFFQKKLQEFNT